MWYAAGVPFFSFVASMVEKVNLQLADKVVPASRIACSEMRKVLLGFKGAAKYGPLRHGCEKNDTPAALFRRAGVCSSPGVILYLRPLEALILSFEFLILNLINID
jgi:hypothetical protein